MRAVLLFPPLAGPTYAPLGIASLAAHLGAASPELDLSLRDANVAWWHRVAAADPEGARVVAFCQGRDGRFFDPAAYAEAVPGLSALWARMQAERARVERWLATGDLAPDLAAHLALEAEAVLARDPGWIGLSALYPEQVPFAVAIARALRQADGAGSVGAFAADDRAFASGRRRILLGGAALSGLRPEALLAACPWLDGLVIGEGEPAVAALAAGAPPEAIPGLVHRTTGGPRRNPSSATFQVRAWPLPDFSGLDLRAYWNPEPVLPLVGSRGCSWRRCRFCAHNASLGRHRAKDAPTLVAELETLALRHGARHVYLADQAVEPRVLDALADALGAGGPVAALQAMMRPTPDLTAAQLHRWSAAGLRWVSWGVETASQRLLDLVQKGVRADRLLGLLEAAAAADIANLPMMIFGLPTSTDADAEATFGFLEAAWPLLAGLTESSFVLFSNTPFGRRPERYGLEPRGAEPALRLGDRVVPSHRLRFQERTAEGERRPPRGPLEVAAWRRRAAWLPDLPVTDQMPVEHLLLYAAQKAAAARTPPLPGVPTPGVPTPGAPTPGTPAPSAPPSPAAPPLAA